jgi:hypothetical protein
LASIDAVEGDPLAFASPMDSLGGCMLALLGRCKGR